MLAARVCAPASTPCTSAPLRNFYHAIRISDDTLSRQQQQRLRKAIFRDFHHIWQAKQLITALRRYRQVVRRYRTSQPEGCPLSAHRLPLHDRLLRCPRPPS